MRDPKTGRFTSGRPGSARGKGGRFVKEVEPYDNTVQLNGSAPYDQPGWKPYAGHEHDKYAHVYADEDTEHAVRHDWSEAEKRMLNIPPPAKPSLWSRFWRWIQATKTPIESRRVLLAVDHNTMRAYISTCPNCGTRTPQKSQELRTFLASQRWVSCGDLPLNLTNEPTEMIFQYVIAQDKWLIGTYDQSFPSIPWGESSPCYWIKGERPFRNG